MIGAAVLGRLRLATTEDESVTGDKRDRAAANRAIREADRDSPRARYEAGKPMRGLAVEVLC